MGPVLRNSADINLSFAMPHACAATLQQQIHTQLRAIILEGRLKAGIRLPSSRTFAKQQNVSRNTVIAAYDQLIAEGYLETRRGAGTFVAADLPELFIQTRVLAGPESDNLVTAAQTKKIHTEPSNSGLPAIDLFPKDIWARLTSGAWRRADADILQYSDPLGYLPLRQAIADYLASSRNVHASPDQVFIVAGLQQGLKFVADSLLKNNSHIILEDPGYGGLFRTASACKQHVTFTSVDASGAVVPPLSYKNSLLIVCPSHQYPLGMTMPITRRLELIEWARATGSLILEDDYDSEFRYSGRPLNSLQGIAEGNHVIYGGTFSKSVFPALRVGYLVLPLSAIDAVRTHRAAVDSFPSIVSQLILSEFITSGHFNRHIRRLRKVHSERHILFRENFDRHLSPYFTLKPSDAGLQLIAQGTKALMASPVSNDLKWARLVLAAGLSAHPLSQSYRAEKAKQGLLMGFANFTESEMIAAFRKLAQKMLEETGF